MGILRHKNFSRAYRKSWNCARPPNHASRTMEKYSKRNPIKNLVSKILYADFHFRYGTNMLDTSVIRILSGLLAIILFVSYILFFGVFTRKKQDPGSVRASKPTGFILINVWFFLGSLPIIFYVLGAAVPGLVYGTPLNISFYGADFLQLVSVFLVLFAPIIFLWSARVLGQYMRPEIEVREKHELVTRGPYSHIRHPTYTGHSTCGLGSHSSLPQHDSCTRIFSSRRYRVQESGSRGRASFVSRWIRRILQAVHARDGQISAEANKTPHTPLVATQNRNSWAEYKQVRVTNL